MPAIRRAFLSEGQESSMTDKLERPADPVPDVDFQGVTSKPSTA
jgi:hypothetical protein